MREFKEEVGVDIDPTKLKFLGMWVDTYYYQEEDQFILNIVYLMELDGRFEVKAGDDVAELTWAPLTEKPDFAFSHLHQVWKKIKDIQR